MKKSFIAMGTIAAVTMFVAGCASTGNRSEAQERYEKFKSERPAVVVVNSGDESLDSVAVASAKVYGSTVKYLDEYIAKTENNRQYVGFCNEVQDKMDNDKNLTKDQARQEVLAEIKKEDEGKPEGEKNYERVIDGLRSVEALHPKTKLKELALLTIDAANVLKNASGLTNSFKGFDVNTLKKLDSAKNILNQAKYSAEAIDFLIRQYGLAENMENYMK